MNKIAIIFLLMLCMSGLIACNTVEGMGRDLERAGQTIQDQF